ncbi:hypothetical protein RhiJN_20406 [Ceratobasidium sp. AG-Ba]|nr:hypothetical protein RhiJN_20406 [Ceratobasidium sp. AG-Ba]
MVCLLRRGSGVRHPVTLLCSEITSSIRPFGIEEMLLEDIDVWIKTDSGQRLAEYKRVRSKGDTVECWIPSEEGKNFTIYWDWITRPKHSRLGLRCSLWLDGGNVSRAKLLPPSDISAGVKGKWSSINTGEGRRRFLFSKLQLTDEEHFMSDGFGQYRPQTIKVKITWIKGFKKVYLRDDAEVRRVVAHKDSIRGPSTSESATHRTHEQLVRKGHDGSAQLGPLLRTNAAIPAIVQDKKPFRWDYTESGRQALFFIFHYAPLEWLQAKDIISRPTIILPTSSCDANGQASQKGAHDPDSPENFQQGLGKLEETENMSKQERLKVTWLMDLAAYIHELPGSISKFKHSIQATKTIRAITAPPKRRSREWSPPDVIEEALVSSDEEIVLLEFKPSGSQARKRLRCEMNRRELKSEPGVSAAEPAALIQQEVDLWRLGC